MAVTRYSALDASAPVLDGQHGTLVNVLDGCLASGYGALAAAGWTIPYFDTNKSVFRSANTGNEFYYRIDDNISSFDNLAQIDGYETMSDVDTGTGKFPTLTQALNDAWLAKSNVISSAARDWLVIANEHMCYLIINTANSLGFTTAQLYAFGDATSLSGSDAFLSVVAASITKTAALGNIPFENGFTVDSVSDRVFGTRSFTQIGAGVKLGYHWDSSKDGVQYPNPVDGSLLMGRVYITEPDVVRGYFPGLWHLSPDAASFNHNDTFSGTGTLAGKTFEIIRCNGNHAYAIETSNTW